MGSDVPTATLLRQLDFDVNGVLRAADISDRPSVTLFNRIKKLLRDIRTDFYAYEYADSADEQRDQSRALAEHLAKLNKAIIGGSQLDMFSPIDVAELGATIDTLIARTSLNEG